MDINNQGLIVGLPKEQYYQILKIIANNPSIFLSTFYSINTVSKSKPFCWLIDNGTSDCIEPSSSIWDKKKISYNSSVSTHNGSHLGNYVLAKDLEINNVLYVPSFTNKLMSISKLTKQHNYAIIFLS